MPGKFLNRVKNKINKKVIRKTSNPTGPFVNVASPINIPASEDISKLVSEDDLLKYS